MDISQTLQTQKDNSYNIIYADPPWAYNRTVGNGTLKRKNGTLHYPSMTKQQLQHIGTHIDRIAKKDAALLLWATMPLLPEAIELITAWGFKYKTCFVTWVKTTKDGKKPAFGVGYYTRSNAELCLLAIRGKFASYKKVIPEEEPRKPNVMSQIIHNDVVMEPKREHSRKPDIVRNMIVQLFGDLPRLEMFARQSSPGWCTLGNQTDLFENQQQLSELKKPKKKKKKPTPINLDELILPHGI